MTSLSNIAGPVSSYVARWVAKLDSTGCPKALDLPCGGGRHSLHLAEMGFEVIAADLDPKQLAKVQAALATLPTAKIATVSADATKPVLLPLTSFALILTTHFVCTEWLRQTPILLRRGGHLIYESFDGHGENWRGLPRTGDIAAILKDDFELLDYRERPSGPSDVGAVTVKAVARRI